MNGFYESLKSDKGFVSGHDVYFKGVPFIIKGSENLLAYPVYAGQTYDHFDCEYDILEPYEIPGTVKVSGIYIPEKQLYISDSYKAEDFEGDGLSVLSFKEIKKDFTDKVMDAVQSWMEHEDVEAGLADEDTVKSLFERGVFDINLYEEKLTFKNFIKKQVNDCSIDYLSYISGIMQEKENVIADMIRKSENFLRKTKANKKLLNQLVADEQKKKDESGGQDTGCRRREVLNLFQKLEKDGYKNCTAFFNFAGKEVSTKVSLCETYVWVKGVRKATEKFEKDNFMPISMSRYFLNRDAFLPFIVRIEIRNKCYYEAEPLDIPKENLLYNELLMSENKLSMEYLEEKYPSADCSVSPADGDIVLKYISRYEATEDGLKYLLNHGADGREAYQEILSLKNTSHRGYVMSTTTWNIMRFHDFMTLGDNEFANK